MRGTQLALQPDTFLFRCDPIVVKVLAAADINDVRVLVCCVQTVLETPPLPCPDRRPVEVEGCVGPRGDRGARATRLAVQLQGVSCEDPGEAGGLHHGQQGVLRHGEEHRALRGHLAPHHAGAHQGDGGEADRPLVGLLQGDGDRRAGEDLSGLLQAGEEPVEAPVIVRPLDTIELSPSQLVVADQPHRLVNL